MYYPHISSIHTENAMLSHAQDTMQSGADLLIKIRSNPLPFFSSYPDGCLIHKVTLAHMNFCNSNPLTKVHDAYIYIDGGFNTKEGLLHECTWSLACVVEDFSGNQKLIASQGGVITCDPTSTIFIGQVEPIDSYLAEVYAQCMARLFLVQHYHTLFGDQRIPVTIVYDNVSANYATYRISKHPKQLSLSLFAHTLHTICLNDGIDLFSHHVHSHCDHPWNELADAICCHYMIKPPNILSYGFAPVTLHHARMLALFSSVQYENIEEAMIIDSLPLYRYSVKDEVVAHNIDHHNFVDSSKYYEEASHNIVQYNIRTLLSHKLRKTIEILFHKSYALIMCLQEARPKSDSLRDLPEHIVAASAADNGSYGCEIWISKKRPFFTSNGHKTFIQHHNVTIIVAEPRLLIISVRIKHIKILIISAHAPHSANEDRKAWWLHFKSTILSLSKRFANMYIGIDANTSFGKHLAAATGQVGNSFKPTKDCMFVLDILNDLGLIVVNSHLKFWSHKYITDPHTFTTIDGNHESLIDYILVSRSVKPKSSSVEGVLDLVPHDYAGDHLPIMTSLSPTLDNHIGPVKRRVCKYDYSKIGIEKFDATFKSLLKQFVHPPYICDQSTHLFIANSYIYHAACIAYPKNVKHRDPEFPAVIYSATVSRNQALKKFEKSNRLCSKATLYFCFHAIACNLRRCKFNPLTGFIPKYNLKVNIASFLDLRKCNKEVEYYMATHRIVQLEDNVAKLEEAFAQGNIVNTYHILGKLKRKSTSSNKVFRLHDSNDIPVLDILEEKQLVREHFAKQLKGSTSTLANVINKIRNEHSFISLATIQSVPIEEIAQYIPNLFDLEMQFQHAPANKATGEDLIKGKLLSMFCKPLAQILYPVVFKSFVRVSAPFQWRGGMLTELFKAKGSSKYLDNYRDIFLGDFSGKAIFKRVRKLLIPYAFDLVGDFQFGAGFNGGETALPHLYVRLYTDYCNHHKINSSLLFVDVASAFASLMRRIIFDTEQGDEAWLKSLSNIGFSKAEIDAITHFIINIHSSHNENSPPPPLPFALSQSQYSNSWFSTEYLSNVVHTTQGSMAGMTLADLVYAAAFSKVIHTLIKSLQNDDLIPIIGEGMHVFPVAFHDDLVIPTRTDTALQLVPHNLRVADIMCTVFNMFCLTVNFLPGKTASLVAFFGKGSKQAHLQLQAANFKISTDHTHCNQFSLQFDKTYKHMGTKLSLSFGMAEEVTYRTIAMRSGIKLYIHIFNNPKIPLKCKIAIVNIYLLTKGTFQCGTWPILNTTQANKFHATILHIYRRATGNLFKVNSPDGDMFSDIDLLHKYNFSQPSIYDQKCQSAALS